MNFVGGDRRASVDPNFATPFIFVAHATIRPDLCLASPPLPLALAARPPSSPVFASSIGGKRRFRGSGKNQIEAPPCDFYTTTPWWSGNPFGTIATVGSGRGNAEVGALQKRASRVGDRRWRTDSTHNGQGASIPTTHQRNPGRGCLTQQAMISTARRR